MTMKLMSRLGLSEGAARTKAQLMVEANRAELLRICRMAKQTGELDASLEIGALTDELTKDAPALAACRQAGRRPSK